MQLTPRRRGSDRSGLALRGVALALAISLLAGACGADGIEAPYTEPADLSCPTVDDRLSNVLDALDAGQLDELRPVMERFSTERDGVRLERAMQFLLGVLQALPREVAERFEYALVYGLLEEIRQPGVAVADFLAEGPPERRAIFSVLRDMFFECSRDSLLVSLNDLFKDSALLGSAGAALSDASIVSLLANIPDSASGGRAGFVALMRTVVNAIQSPSFDFGQLRGLLVFLELDEPPMSGLLDALDAYLAGERLAHLRTALDCLEAQTGLGVPGSDVLGGFIYDLITMPGLDLAALLSLAAPTIERLNEPGVQTLLRAVLDRLLEDTDLRDLGIELVVFFLREDNIQPVLRATSVLLETRGIDDVLWLFEGLTVRCGSDDGVGQ